jgi:hypothetical protein
MRYLPLATLLLALSSSAHAAEPTTAIRWADDWLDIQHTTADGQQLPLVRVHYLEAYCRNNSHTTDWVKHTVIPHKAVQLSPKPADESSNPGVAPFVSSIHLRDTLADGVTVDHVIAAQPDGVDFQLTAVNPTDKISEAVWAQPCIRVGPFTGGDQKSYLPKCFIFLDGKLATMPTRDWATEARYTPGQVWAGPGVARDDVNPRPVNPNTPSNGLIGCFSADDKYLFATAWQPYQELFQGVAACIHSDFRLGGLSPHETKTLRGKIYFLPNDVPALLKRYETDFPPKPHN